MYTQILLDTLALDQSNPGAPESCNSLPELSSHKGFTVTCSQKMGRSAVSLSKLDSGAVIT